MDFKTGMSIYDLLNVTFLFVCIFFIAALLHFNIIIIMARSRQPVGLTRVFTTFYRERAPVNGSQTRKSLPANSYQINVLPVKA